MFISGSNNFVVQGYMPPPHHANKYKTVLLLFLSLFWFANLAYADATAALPDNQFGLPTLPSPANSSTISAASKLHDYA